MYRNVFNKTEIISIGRFYPILDGSKTPQDFVKKAKKIVGEMERKNQN